MWGGTVSVVGWHLQTDRYLPEPTALEGAVLALETAETVPPPRRVGYLLRSMGERGLLGRFDGVLVGRPRTAGPEAEREPDHETYVAALRAAVEDELDRYCPEATAAFDLDFGHTEPSFPLPLGARARLDPEAGELAFE